MLEKLFRKPPLSKVINKDKPLAKSLDFLNLFFYEISFSFGAGSYCLIGYAAQYAGPSIPITFIIVGFFCFFIGLPFIEFSTSVPSCGFSYTFVQVSWGEYIGFICGYLLTFAITFTISLQARSWAMTLVNNLNMFGIYLPKWIYSITPFEGIDLCLLPAVLIIPLTIIVNRGARDSAFFNTIVAFFSISGLIYALINGLFYIDLSHFNGFSQKGISGIFQACGLAFFAYSGFEQITVFSEEAKNVNRDIPLTIIAILILQTIINGGISFVMIGMAPLSIMNNESSLLTVFEYRTNSFSSAIISIGMVVSLIAVTFGNIISQTRVFFTMSNDGMIPPHFSRMNQNEALYFAANCTCIVSVIFSVLIGVEILGNAISIAALIISVLVVQGLILHRNRNSNNLSKIGIANGIFMLLSLILGFAIQYRWNLFTICFFIFALLATYIWIKSYREDEDLNRIFTCPMVPEVPLIGGFGFMIMAGAVPFNAWIFFLLVIALGIPLYFLYGYSHSTIDIIVEKKEKEMNLLNLSETYK